MTITAKYAGRCAACGGAIRVGEPIEWSRGGPTTHAGCAGKATRPARRRPYRERRDHEDCLSTGPCGPNCEYAHIFRR